MSQRKVPAVLKRWRRLTHLIESAESNGAAVYYMALLARMTVGYDPSREVGSPRRG